MQPKHIQRAGLAAFILLLGLLTACTGSGETSAVEPQTVVLTQVVTQIVIPTALPKPTKTPEPAEGASSAGYGGFDPYSVPIYYPLNGCSASRLAVGDEAYITYSGGLVGLYRHKDLAQEPDLRYTQAYRIIEGVWKRSYRFYYASTYWAFYAFPGVTGEIWYQIIDDKTRDVYMVKAEDLRPVTAEELTPISPGVSDKLIEVDLEKQRLVAYENQRPVFTTRIATGYFEGNTPRGEFRVERKQPSRHMATNMEGNGAPFDLPGVPWVSYISWTGVSIHGTYWHHNYGTPQSHGCINLPPEAAKWIYRWSEPFVPVEEDYVETKTGTRVIVF